jgi:hypothetical protein
MHDDATRPDIDGFTILLALKQLWCHKVECAASSSGKLIAAVILLKLETKPEIDDPH